MATTLGFIFGAQGGIRNLKGKDSDFLGRLLAGYNFSPNIGLELGLSIFEAGETSKNNFYTDDLNLLGRFSLPLTCNLNIHAKVGVSILQSQFYMNEKNIRLKDDSHFYVAPQAGIGLSYAFTPRISGEIDYLRTFAGDNLKDSNFYGLGMTVKLGRV